MGLREVPEGYKLYYKWDGWDEMGWTSERPSAKNTYSAKKYELLLNIQKLSGFQKVQSYENL